MAEDLCNGADNASKDIEIERLRRELDVLKAWVTNARYAMTTGTYLADMAEGLLTAINELTKAEEEFENGTSEPDTLAHLRDVRNDHWAAVQNTIYEYRARAQQLAKGGA